MISEKSFWPTQYISCFLPSFLTLSWLTKWSQLFLRIFIILFVLIKIIIIIINIPFLGGGALNAKDNFHDWINKFKLCQKAPFHTKSSDMSLEFFLINQTFTIFPFLLIAFMYIVVLFILIDICNVNFLLANLFKCCYCYIEANAALT